MDFWTLTPSWDILILAALFIVALYGFIVGESKTIKALLSIYPAFFVADLFSLFIPSLFPNLSIALIKDNAIAGTVTLSQQLSSLHIVVGIKVILFILVWLALIRISFFEIEAKENGSSIGNMFLFGIISLSFSLLFINVLLLLLSGWSVIGFDPALHVLEAMQSSSFLSIQFVKYYGVFFALPALILLFSVFLYSPEKTDEEDEE